jgi:hypothetical protein
MLVCSPLLTPTRYSIGRIIDELVLAVMKEGVPVEISRP